MSLWSKIKDYALPVLGAYLGYQYSGFTGAIIGGAGGALLSGSLNAPKPAAAPAPVATPPEPPKQEAKPAPEPKKEVAAPAPVQQVAYTPPPTPQLPVAQPVIQQATQEPVINNPAVQAARDDTRRRIIASEGQQSTILTGEDGIEEDPIVRKRKVRGRTNILGG
jgi:hypothetical protein